MQSNYSVNNEFTLIISSQHSSSSMNVFSFGWYLASCFYQAFPSLSTGPQLNVKALELWKLTLQTLLLIECLNNVFPTNCIGFNQLIALLILLKCQILKQLLIGHYSMRLLFVRLFSLLHPWYFLYK